MTQYKVKTTNWRQERAELHEIRRKVFIEEQGVSEALEWDNKDEGAEHFIVYEQGTPIACARMLDQCKIGRMAVLPAYRNQGIGSQILDHIKRHASQKRYTKLELDAQCHAFQFYRNNEFTACSTPFDDANMPHIKMEHRVFAQQQSSDTFVLGKDDELHHGKQLIEALGYLELLLSQTNRSIIITANDLNHPVTRHPYLIQKCVQLAKQNRHFKLCLLISSYHPSFNEHPIFKLQDRLPSYIDIRVANDTIPTKWIFDGKAWFDYEAGNSRVCFGDRPRCTQLMERYQRWWQSAKEPIGARRLSI